MLLIFLWWGKETIIIYYLQINLFDYNSKTNTGLFSKIALLIFL